MPRDTAPAGISAGGVRNQTCWHVRRAADALDDLQLLSTEAGRATYGPLVSEVQRVLRSWDRRRVMLGTFLNRKTFLHEVEEAIVPLSLLIDRVRRMDTAPVAAPRPRPLLVFDLCCGKGLTGVVLSYLLPAARIHLFDANGAMDLAHVAARPNMCFTQLDLFSAAALRQLADAAATARPRAAVAIGTHLCGAMSPRLIDLALRLPAAGLALGGAFAAYTRGSDEEYRSVAEDSLPLTCVQRRPLPPSRTGC